MDVFESFKPSLCTLDKLNAVRLYLQVLTLADITDKLGQNIKAWALAGTYVATICIDWPYKERPPDSYWILWRSYLKKAFAPATAKSHQLNKPIKLETSLGEWTTTHSYTTRKYYHDPTNNRAQAQTALAVESPTTFVAYIDQQPHRIKRLLGNLHADDVDPEYWIQAISNGKVAIATDGSVAQKKVYFAVVFHTDNKCIRYQGPCDGNASLMTSYRTELTGILSALYLLQAIIKFTETSPACAPPLLCDNIAAVKRTNNPILPGIKTH
eukprot:13070123-Ditylum_brightwellii.AAC.1